MRYFDLHLHSGFSGGQSSIDQLASVAKELGYTGICFSEYFQNGQRVKELKEDIAKVGKKTGIEIYLGFEARNAKELHNLVMKRRMFDILLVHGGELEMNRLACETPEVDILTHPENKRNDSGLNHVLVKMAAENNVAIEINFREILHASNRTRSLVVKSLARNIVLAKKFHAPLILSSGAISHFELRDPLAMISMANQLGLELKDAKECMSKVPENILKQSKERKSDKWIMPGVKVVK